MSLLADRWCLRLVMGAIAVAPFAFAMALGTSSASAARGVVAIFGQEGTGAGDFTFPGGVAVNDASGDVYVADVGESGTGQRIQQFTADGEFIRAWGWGVDTGAATFEVCSDSCLGGIQGSGAGQFSFRAQDPDTFVFMHPQIAIDQADGSLYVADTLNNRVQKFTASGAYTGQFGVGGSGDAEFNIPQGIAVDPSTRDVYVADTGNNRVQRFSSAGAYVSQIGPVAGGVAEGEFTRPKRVAVDSSGRLYVLDVGNARVQRFTSGGEFDQILGSVSFCAFGDPDLAVDPVTDHVFVRGCDPDLTTSGIVEIDADGLLVEVHPLPFEVVGLAVRSLTGRLYAPDRDAPRVAILDEVSPPTVAVDPVGDVSATGATFSGVVNPHGRPSTGYHFEYSTDGLSWTSAPASDVPVGSGDLDIPVSEAVTGLEPNTEYRVRLVASKDFAAASATSSEVTFKTDVARPLVRALAAGGRTGTAAWLGGEVNAQNSPTTYFVEYALESDSTYSNGSRVPLAPAGVAVGEGNVFVPVRQLVTGLQPETAYRFRVVATNTAGTTPGPDVTFVTDKAPPAPPGGRGYEMVSPLDKNGGNVDRNLGDVGQTVTSGASVSGNVVAYAATSLFAGVSSGAVAGQYRSERGEAGWSTRGITPPLAPDPFSDALSPTVEFLSEDLSQAIVSTSATLVEQAGQLGGSWGLYLQDHTGPTSSYRLLSTPAQPLPPIPPSSVGKLAFSFGAASSDLKHVAFESAGRQLSAEEVADRAVYQWSDGQLRLASILPSGEPAFQGQVGGGVRNSQFYPGVHPISDDGERVFFTDGPSNTAGPLYVREHGATTRALSASERDGDDPSVALDAKFQAAKASDGSVALFTSRLRLTDDATATAGNCDSVEQCHDDLYRWDGSAPAGERLTDLTTGDPQGGGVLGIAAAADDLSRVYFVATGTLTEDAAVGRPNLYLWSPGQGVRRIATLDPSDAAIWGTDRSDSSKRFRDARLSADGSTLLFASRGRLTGDETGGHAQIYRYDAVTDRLACVSCTSDGSAVTGDSWLFYPPEVPGRVPATPYRLPRNLSADGSKAFFETAQKLVAADTNGKPDVYEWSNGTLSLISAGAGRDAAEFVDASADGRDVFFTTRERLVGSDVDSQVDLYDARVGGGFPEQKLPPPCEGDECQGPLASRPDLISPADGSAEDGGVAAKPRSFSVGKLSVAQRRSLARGRTARLSVRVTAPGGLTVRGVARMRGRTKRVLSGIKTARRAGVVRVPLQLSPMARRQLNADGRLKVRLVVRFAGVRKAGSQTLTLRAISGRKDR